MKHKVMASLAALVMFATLTVGIGISEAGASKACNTWDDHTHRVVGNSRIKYRHVNHGWNYFLVIRTYNGRVTNTWRDYSCVA